MERVLGLVVLFLAFSHLICLNAIPITRIGRLNMHEHPQNENLLVAEKQIQTRTQIQMQTETEMERETETRRMIVQVNDYPGSGANHRHTPWPPQLARSCVDC